MSGPGENIPEIGKMLEATGMMHELYITLQQSGFTADEALRLLSGMLVGIVEAATTSKTSGPGSA